MKDSRIILLLLFALFGQIMLLLWHMEFFTFTDGKKSVQQGKLAGEIVKIENNLKRRPLESLIWSESNPKEKIYFFDSILTLKESTAQIQLENGTQISLSENTLITIEPPDKENSGEIRIQFTQGSLKTRNPYQSAKIQNDKMYLNIKADSDVEIFKNNKDSLEIHVNKGEVSLDKDDGKMNLTANQVYREKKGQVETLTKDASLNWVTPPLTRLYTHNKTVPIHLKWIGEATKIRILSLDKESQTIGLEDDQKQIKIDLPMGLHRLQLESKGAISETLSVQVWQAPLIHLISPQPRNRYKLDNIEFIWAMEKSVKKYHLKIKGKNRYQDQSVQKNSQIVHFKDEDDVIWGVWGEDQEGFLIPPLYDYELYLRENPFAAPKLNSPQLIKPQEKKNKQSLYFFKFFFMNTAYAVNSYQALFSWEKIEGADLYWFEVSESIDFRETVVRLKLNEASYLWTNLDSHKKYFWRVAAGSLDGRMGLFSEPTEVVMALVENKAEVANKKEKGFSSLKNKTDMGLKEESHSVVKNNREAKVDLLRAKNSNKSALLTSNERDEKNSLREKIKDPANKEVVTKQPLVKGQETIAAVDEGRGVKKKRKSFVKGHRLWLRPGYSLKSFQENATTQGDFDGFTFVGFGFFKTMNWRQESLLNFSMRFSQATYRPTSKRDYPFQEEFPLIHMILDAHWKNEKSNWAYGGTLQYLPMIQRQSFENIIADQKIAGGPQIQWMTSVSKINYVGQAALLFSDGLYGLSSNHQIYFFPFARNFYLGLEVELQYLYGQDKKSQITDGFLNIGIQF